MAELVVYSYHGPGEQLTAEALAQGLPDSWVVIAGRVLPTPQKDDADLLVVGDNFIYVLEEKHWGPAVEVLNGGWRVKGQIRESPIGRNNHLARVLAGVLRSSVTGFQRAAGRRRLVDARVVLSYPELDLDTRAYPYDDEQILLLHDAVGALTGMDAEQTGLHEVRPDAIEFLSGLKARQGLPERLGHFTVAGPAEGVGRARLFVARDDDGDPALLMAYPMDGWGPGADVRELVRHERIATNRIADIHRAWRAESAFPDEARRWIVLPIRPAPSVSLKRYAAGAQIPVRGPGGLTARAQSIVLNAFEALAEVHQQGVIHRGIMPSRVLVGRNDRVLFRDFYLAHASSEHSVAIDIADMVDGSAPFRAPEAAMIVRAATERSDVYALALSLLWWINGDVKLAEESDIRALSTRVERFDPVIDVLLSCLDEDANERPNAESVLEELRALSAPPAPQATAPPSAGPGADAFVPNGHVGGGRYLLERQLGSGGFATSWLAKDNQTGGARVIKQYTDPDAVRAAKQEFEAAARLVNPRCARVWDYSPEPPVYLVSEYVSGQSLRDVGEAGTPSEEDFRQVALDALEGLAYMHSEGQLHRDVSPTNVIVRDDGRAVLIDFGLTASAERAVSVAGTPPFMAPEVETSGTWTSAADMYSLGVSLLRTMLRRSPYGATGPFQLHKYDVQLPTAEEEETWGPTGTAILKAFFRLVEPDPSERPRSASEFADYLRTVSAPPMLEGKRAINPTVLNLRRLYRGSHVGNAGNRGLDDQFARETYAPTLLDTALAPSVMAGGLDVVLLTGNPGDGKTSFLAMLRDKLLDAGATDVQSPSPGGWRMQLDGRTFASVYDASEAREGKSSDELMHEALQGAGRHTALIAINDGRLLNFFADYSDIYPDCYQAVDHYEKGIPGDNPRIAIVDLKTRSLAPTQADDQGLAGAVLDSFTGEQLWATCEGCTARQVCPILVNRDLLRGSGRSPLLELVTVSHLRRKRRATFRDVRSALAWTLTGDLGCDDIHNAVEEGRDVRMSERALAFDLAFDVDNPDYLISEWALLDPETLAAPRVERAIRDGSFGLDTSPRPGSPNRLLFFDGFGVSPVGRTEVRAYRYLDDFLDALSGRVDMEALRARLLRGLSHVLGAHGYNGSALALRDGEGGGWSVLREIAAEDFEVRPVPPVGSYVEQQPDALRLSHRLGSIALTLDSYEMVLRAADGEILGDVGAEAIKLELRAFGDVLRRTPGRRVLVVDPAGRPDPVSVADGTIFREDVHS